MKAKLFTALKTKYAHLGLSEQIMEGVAAQLLGFVKEETDIEGVTAGAEPLLKQIQGEADRRANSYKSEGERLKAEIADAKKKLEELSKKDADPPAPPKDTDTPDWAKALISKVGTLEAGLTAFNAEQTGKALSGKAAAVLKEKGVPEAFYAHSLAGRTFKEETETTAFAEGVVKAYEDFKQQAADIGFNYAEPPQNSSPPQKAGDEIAALIREDTKRIVENNKK